MSSKLADFRMILDELIYWLSYDLTFFGVTMSILQVFFACALLSLAISMVVRLFIGGN